jgi:hypothetical protein
LACPQLCRRWLTAATAGRAILWLALISMRAVALVTAGHMTALRGRKLRMELKNQTLAADPGGTGPVNRAEVRWADVLQISIRRDRLEWQDIALRR